jgi:hypothetical protein
MSIQTELRFATAISSMKAYLEPHRQWIESVLGCPQSDSLTFELETPFGQFAAGEILSGASLDRQCRVAADALRHSVVRWELPPGASPRIGLIPRRNREALCTSKATSWDPQWKDVPVAIWLKGLEHAVIAATVPFVSLQEGPRSQTREWLLVRRSDAAQVLNYLGSLPAERSGRVNVLGGRDILLPETFPGWDSLVLDAQTSGLVRRDFETFLERETWYRRNSFPFRRGYLLHGPPGNGKTSMIRAMASHPMISAFSLDFANPNLDNDALSDLFSVSGYSAPSLVILEDLDRLFGKDPGPNNRTSITLQCLLNHLDGLGNHEGIIVVATANDAEKLDSAILRRPGRFDRVVPFPLPSAEIRREYLKRLTGNSLTPESLNEIADRMEGRSFAQIRETYILASQRAFERSSGTVTLDCVDVPSATATHVSSGTVTLDCGDLTSATAIPVSSGTVTHDCGDLTSGTATHVSSSTVTLDCAEVPSGPPIPLTGEDPQKCAFDRGDENVTEADLQYALAMETREATGVSCSLATPKAGFNR